MNQAEITTYLAASHIAVVATINRHGHPHLTPNWYRYDGKVLTLITRKDRLKYLNLQRDNHISVCIYDPPAASNYVVISYCIHKAKAVKQWLAHHPRFALLWLPTYCPRANPIERVFGDVHDKCTRNHQRKRLRDLVKDVERHMEENGLWKYKLSHLYDAPEVTVAVEHIAAEQQAKIAA